MYLFLSPEMIRNNWEAIKKDPYNNRPDIKDAEEYIVEASNGRVTAGGVPIIIVNKLPSSFSE